MLNRVSLALNYSLSIFVQEDANGQGEMYPASTTYGIICGIRKYLNETGKRTIVLVFDFCFAFMHES